MRTPTRIAIAAAAVAGSLALLSGPVAAADEGPTFPPRDERCKVPTVLIPVAALVDVDSLEGCGYFEDPNFFENRKDAGQFDDNGLFTRIFG